MNVVQEFGNLPREDDLAYWREKLAEIPPALQLPTARPRRAGQGFRAESVSRPLPGEVSRKTRQIAADEGASLFDLLLTAFAVLLQRTTAQTDIVVGASVPEVLPLRTQLPDHLTVREALSRVRTTIREAQQHGRVSLPDIMRAAGVHTEPVLSALFATEEGRAAAERALSHAEIALLVTETPDLVVPTLVYDAGLFDEVIARRMLGHFETLLSGIVARPGEPIATLPLLTEPERRQLLREWNDTALTFPDQACLHHLFERWAGEEPHAVAAIFDGTVLTYGELNQRANQVAHHLRSLGVGPDVLVGLCVERSLELVIGLLAIAKAGGAYVPMDPSYPRERLAFMLADAHVSVLLTQKHLGDSLPDSDAAITYLDADRPLFDKQRRSDPEGGATADNLAYVIYTSGSTGQPKGVMLNHRGRVNNFLDFNHRFSVGSGDRLIALASLSFDMCAYDVFGTLAAGAAVILPRPEQMEDPASWTDLMRRHEVTIWHTAPAMLKMLVDWLEQHPDGAPQSLRLALLGGDWIPLTLPGRLRALVEDVRVISMGGATECSMDSTIYEIGEVDPAWNSIPYGRPMINQLAYVLDAHFQPLPIGVPGELYLGGIGVGRGYLNRPDLTAERFLKNPFVDQAAARMYRTGDLARWMPDGNLELLGRIDNQVKIRGYRIELGEIEAELRAHPAVKEGVVTTRTSAAGDKRLVAYFVQHPAYRGPEAHAGEINAEQVEQWQAVYDQAYSRPPQEEDPTFNIASWDSSYTGKPIPAEEMRAWVEQTVERIERHRPERVLEIGCGLGLLLFRIAPSCARYLGTDISKVALDYVARHRETLGLRQVELRSLRADDFSGLDPGSFDAVVLNSIVLDFPSMDYLLSVLRGAVEAVRPGGVVFVGDVRPLALVEAFQTSVQLHQAADDLPVEKLRQRIARTVKQEEELVIEPAFFVALKHLLPRVSRVQIQLKRGRAPNELSRFRYDATLYVDGPKPPPPAEVVRLDGGDETLLIDRIRDILAGQKPEALYVRDISNARVQRDVLTVDVLRDPACPPTAGGVRQALAAALSSRPGLEPEDFWQLEKDFPYSVDVRWSESWTRGRFDVVLRRRSADGATLEPVFPDEPLVDLARPAASFGSNPLLGKGARQLVSEVRRYLETRLPPYMVPTTFVPLEALPLSPNGKVDRKALPAPDTARPDLETSFTPPGDALQEVMAAIWADVLGLDRVGVHDAFLDLGGNSLLAAQVQARLSEIYPFGVPIREIFESRTVAALCGRMRLLGSQAAVDAVVVSSAYQEMQELSDEQVTNMVATRCE